MISALMVLTGSCDHIGKGKREEQGERGSAKRA